MTECKHEKIMCMCEFDRQSKEWIKDECSRVLDEIKEMTLVSCPFAPPTGIKNKQYNNGWNIGFRNGWFDGQHKLKDEIASLRLKGDDK